MKHFRPQPLDQFVICSVDGCYSPAKSRGWCNKHYLRWAKHGDPVVTELAGHGEPLKWLRDHVAHTGDDCLEWPFGRTTKGYGAVLFKGRSTYASRAMCEIAHGEAPSEDHQAAHSCGHRVCVNPRHLRWATQSENQIDAVFHGTGRATITPDQVLEIRRLSKTGISHAEVARRVNTTRAVVVMIARGRTWSYLAPDGARIVPIENGD